jgi:hypothetical protein
MHAASVPNTTTPMETKTMHMNAMRLVLAACAWQTKAWNDSAANHTTFQQLQGMGLVPPDPGPPTPSTGCGHASACAAQPGDVAAASGNAGSGKKKKKARAWWLDGADAEWRQEAWVLHDPARTRTIKVKLDKGEWQELVQPGMQQLLTWYDHGRLMDMIKGVVTNENGRAYDYRIEGGKYLTQNNPNFDSAPRECQILYVGAPVEESTWQTGGDGGWRS